MATLLAPVGRTHASYGPRHRTSRWSVPAPLLRVLGAVAVLGLLVRQLGTGPFRAGASALTPAAVGATIVLAAVATACAAWRWRTVAGLLGLVFGQSQAVGAYYRSQLLNSVLPGGIVGDVDRALRLGRPHARIGTAARAVVWERVAGQVVQVVITAAVLLLAPSRLRPTLGPVATVLAAVLLALAVGALGWLAAGRCGVRALSEIVLASVLVVAAHGAVFLLAAHLVAPAAPTGDVVALALLVQTAAAVPLSIGGWGVREGAAAWLFAAAGLGAGTGVETTTVYGLMALLALTPGAVLVLRDVVSRG